MRERERKERKRQGDLGREERSDGAAAVTCNVSATFRHSGSNPKSKNANEKVLDTCP